ncbi:MAG: hypothetical protein OXL36_11305 [Bryobacterales bacterium]|nr:hypothetical protein [Bryobacterales bacterium]
MTNPSSVSPAWNSTAPASQLRPASALDPLACVAHHPTVEAHDTTARTSLRLLAVLNVRFKYACARQAARASS